MDKYRGLPSRRPESHGCIHERRGEQFRCQMMKHRSLLYIGQMRDTVELNPAGVYLLEKLFSKQERAKLFRSWAGAASMLLKGGNAVWGEPNS